MNLKRQFKTENAEMSTHCWQTRSDSRRWCNPVTSVGSPGEMTGARVRFYGPIFFHQQMSSFFFANKIVNDVPSGLEIQAAGCSATGHVCGQQGQRRSSRQEAWATHVTNEFVSFIKLVSTQFIQSKKLSLQRTKMRKEQMGELWVKMQILKRTPI